MYLSNIKHYCHYSYQTGFNIVKYYPNNFTVNSDNKFPVSDFGQFETIEYVIHDILDTDDGRWNYSLCFG